MGVGMAGKMRSTKTKDDLATNGGAQEPVRKFASSPVECLGLLAEEYPAMAQFATLTASLRAERRRVRDLKRLLAELETAIAISAALDGTTATEWRKIAVFLEAQRDLLSMWLRLAAGDVHAAWSSFVSADSAASKALELLPDFAPARHLHETMVSVERCVFPEQKYISPSIVTDASSSECSICGVRGRCDHEPGHIYDGTMAYRIIHHIAKVREVSLVENPASKTRRIYAYGGVDTLTFEPIREIGINRRTKKSSKDKRKR
jgi:hypothetical protein